MGKFQVVCFMLILAFNGMVLLTALWLDAKKKAAFWEEEARFWKQSREFWEKMEEGRPEPFRPTKRELKVIK